MACGSGSLPSPPLLLALGEDVFEELVDGPGDRRRGHLINDPRLDPSEVGGHAAHLVHRPEGIGHACDVSADVGAQGQGLLGVEQRFANVQRRSGSGSDSPCAGSGDHVGAWVVLSVGVELLLKEFVGHEVNGLEGDVHGELGGVAAIESSGPFVAPHSPHTVRHTLVG